MARFDVYRDSAGDLLLDCQADVLRHLNTRFVVPLLPPETAEAAHRLNPVFEIEGEQLVMYTQFASSIAVEQLKVFVVSLARNDFQIGSALDMLIGGY